MWSVSPVRPVALAMAFLLALSAPIAALDMASPDVDARHAAALPSADLQALSEAGPPQDAPLVTGAMNEREIATDPAGDVDLALFGENPAPPQDADAPIDILSLKAAETDRDLVFSLKHRAYPASEGTRSNTLLAEAYCGIAFLINGDKDLRYGIDIGYMYPNAGEYNAFASLFVLQPEEDEDEDDPRFFDREYLGSVPSALIADDHFEILVPKDLFTVARDAPLKIGDQLDTFEIQCSRNSGTFFIAHMDDAMGDPKTGNFPITMATSTNEIALSLPEDARGTVAVATSQTSKVTVEVENVVGRKLLVNLTASVVGTDGKPLPGWSVKAAPTLELKSEGTQPASVIVSVDESVPHRAQGILKVVAFPLGFDDKATFTVPVFAVTPLGPDENILRFHRAPAPGYYCYGICFGSQDLAAISDSNPDFFVLNVLDDDPLYGDEEGEDDGIAMFSTDYAYAQVDAPLAAPIRFDPDGFIDLTLALRSGVARDVQVRVNVWTSEDGALGFVNDDISVTENVEEFIFSMPVNEDLLNLPQGAWLGLSVDFREVDVPPISDTWLSSIEWAPARSSLTLPLVDLPRQQVNVTDGRALPTIALGNATEREEYINPAEGQAFDLILVNEGTEQDVLRLTTKASAPGWTVDFDPGNRFSLSPGSSAPLCMTVTAPKDAIEGDVVNITLTATSKVDAKVKTEIDLTLLVTTGVDVEPSSCREIADEDYVAPLPDTTEESPAVTPLLVLVLAGLVVTALRRRL